MENVKIAVVGKSSAGKSAFIRLFSSTPELINSVGKGQTTRAYVEYLFLKKYDGVSPLVEAKIASQSQFSDSRVAQVLNDFKSETKSKECNVTWINEQLENKTWNSRIKKIMLFSDDFFNIREFLFVDKEIVEKAEIEYNKFVEQICKMYAKSDVDGVEGETHMNSLDATLTDFYKRIYEQIIQSIEKAYNNDQKYVKENNISFFKFYVNDETQELFSLLLKVDDKAQSSFTGIITNVRVSCKLNSDYKACLGNMGFNNIVLIDTHGLDHSNSIEKAVLEERYNKIFNKDYPDVSTVFLVEALHTGSSNDFKNAITTLYEVKPEIMTYIIGTHIDEIGNEKELVVNKNWLFSEDKTEFDTPKLNGKVLQIINDEIDLKATLLDNGISESMADKRCKVMRKRFAPFCGCLENTSSEIDYKRVNITSIRLLFSSVLDREHLGDGYIEIDKIIAGASNLGVLKEFAETFIKNVTTRFKQIYSISAPRTRWRIHENLKDYTLGFDGTTLDATWVRVFRDAFNQTFTKQIEISTLKLTLSDAFKMEGNSKIAFDEVVAEIYPYIFKRSCYNEDKFNCYFTQISCSKCAKLQEVNDCIWNTFITAAKYDVFRKRQDYNHVIEWLDVLHTFSPGNNSLAEAIERKFKFVIEHNLVQLCRERNMYIASKKISKSADSYIKAKKDIYEFYKDHFDDNIGKEYFYTNTNKHLSHINTF